MNQQDSLKQQAAEAVINEVNLHGIIGVGTGSTVDFFIEALAKVKHKIDGAVPSSIATEEKLKQHGIPVLNINEGVISLYIDGADECNHHCQLIKGGGAALTREKIIAAVAKEFVCIIDESKYKLKLGEFPLPIEVIPFARSYVARELVKMGGDPAYRDGVVTDNGNHILDIYNLDITLPMALEEQINNIVGVVTCGLFAKRGADKVFMATSNGIQTLEPR